MAAEESMLDLLHTTETAAMQSQTAPDSSTGPPTDLPPRVGRFVILGELARGGMGIIYTAHDPAFDRAVAVKVLARRLADRPESARRFLDETRVTGRLQHPAIPPVHDLGYLPDGRPYLVMKLIQGNSLSVILENRSLANADQSHLIGILEQIGQAVGYAHSKGVVHRDLKPQNIMVGRFGEVQVMDWGLAKVLSSRLEGVPSTEFLTDAKEPASNEKPIAQFGKKAFVPSDTVTCIEADETDRTVAGSVLGTPGYMAPEQARGEVDRIGPAADVFGLGAILCKILTGKPPFVGESEEVRTQAIGGHLQPAFDRLDRCGADSNLVALAKQWLAPDFADRPADANCVAQALAGYRSSLEARLRAVEIERAAVAAKFAEQRVRRRVQAALAIAVMALAGLIGFGYRWQSKARDTEIAELNRRSEDTTREVSASIQEADTLLAQAGRMADEPIRWEATVAAAADAIKRADGVLSSGIATDELRNRVAAARNRVSQADHDRRFVTRLDGIAFRYLEREQIGVPRGGTSEQYARAFADADLNPVSTEPAEFVRRIAELPNREAVWEAMIDWHWHLSAAQQVKAENAHGDKSNTTQITRDALHTRITLAVASDPFWEHWWSALPGPPSEAGNRLGALAAKFDVNGLSPWAVHRAFCDLWSFGKSDDALVIMRKGLERFPSDYRLHARLGLTLRLDPRPEFVQEALRHCMAAVALRPKSLNAYLELGVCLSKAGQPDAGLPWVHKAIEQQPESAQSYNALGNILFDSKKYVEASKAHQKAIDFEPFGPINHANLAACYLKLGQLQLAIASCEKALEIDSRCEPALNNLGVALGYSRKVSDAIATFRKLLEVNPNSAQGHFNISGFLFISGEVTEAIKHLKRAQELDPKYRPEVPGPPPPQPVKLVKPEIIPVKK